MAIAYARSSVHTRSKGHSAVAAAAYRAGVKLYDERTGETHDYTKRKDVVYSSIMLPDGGDGQFDEREFLWNQVEASENRKNSQVAKEIVLALPKEYSEEHQIEIARRFAHFHFVQHGVIADINIHDKGDGNPHAHILLSTRRLQKNKFCRWKARDLNPKFAKGFVTEQDHWSEKWREFQNDYSADQMLDVRVDLNHLIPEKHEGRVRDENGHWVKGYNADVKSERQEIALNHIDNFINLLSFKQSVFSRRDVEKLLFKSILAHQAVDFPALVERVMSHNDIIELGLGDDGKSRFTTRQHYVAECQYFESVDKLNSRFGHRVNQNIDKLAAQFKLTEEQSEALKFVAQGSDISVVVGKPGTGKTYMLKALNKLYTKNGYEVIGGALASKAAKGLEMESGISSSTLASLNYRISTGNLKLNSKSVVVVDEAGMADFTTLSRLTESVKEASAKLVLVGDTAQLKAIGKGDLFRGVVARAGFICLESIMRQKDLGDRAASIQMSRGDIAAGLTHYDEKASLALCENRNELFEQLSTNWANDIKNDAVKDTVILAFTRRAVGNLNKAAREELLTQKKIDDESFKFKVIKGDKQVFQSDESKLDAKLFPHSQTKADIESIDLAVGERLIFKQKNKTIGVDNGDMATITSINQGEFEARLDTGELVTIKNGRYQHFDYGYALTVHKAQGVSAKNIHMIVDCKYWDKYLSFVAMTRHRENLKIYASKTLFASRKALAKTLSRAPTKDNVIDYPLDYAIRYGFEPDSIAGRMINRVAGIANKVKDKWTYIVNYEGYLRKQEWAISLKEKQRFREAAKRAADYKDYQKEVAKYHRQTSKYPVYEDAPVELRDKLYESGLNRDKAANELWTMDKESVQQGDFNGVGAQKIERGAKRFVDYGVLKQYFEKSGVKTTGDHSFIESLNQVDINEHYMHIIRLSKDKGLDHQKAYRDIEKQQKSYRTELASKLKKENPDLQRFYDLVSRRKMLSGMIADKADKDIFDLAKRIQANKPLAETLKTHLPKTFTTLSNKLSLGLGRDRGIDRER